MSISSPLFNIPSELQGPLPDVINPPDAGDLGQAAPLFPGGVVPGLPPSATAPYSNTTPAPPNPSNFFDQLNPFGLGSGPEGSGGDFSTSPGSIPPLPSTSSGGSSTLGTILNPVSPGGVLSPSGALGSFLGLPGAGGATTPTGGQAGIFAWIGEALVRTALVITGLALIGGGFYLAGRSGFGAGDFNPAAARRKLGEAL